ncbi:MAG: arginine repressor [Agathobacter sp.]|nr:arginine repressor [Agathobacter sp.]
MKTKRQSKILELIRNNDIETQEELQAYLVKAGFAVTQATVSRDIRDMKLTKISTNGGKQKYVALNEPSEDLSEKYVRVLKDGYVSMDMAQNILVIKTVSGMAGAVCASIDAMNIHEIVGSIAGDDTIMCAIRTTEDTVQIMKKLRKIVEQ